MRAGALKAVYFSYFWGSSWTAIFVFWTQRSHQEKQCQEWSQSSRLRPWWCGWPRLRSCMGSTTRCFQVRLLFLFSLHYCMFKWSTWARFGDDWYVSLFRCESDVIFGADTCQRIPCRHISQSGDRPLHMDGDEGDSAPGAAARSHLLGRC